MRPAYLGIDTDLKEGDGGWGVLLLLRVSSRVMLSSSLGLLIKIYVHTFFYLSQLPMSVFKLRFI